MTRGNWITDLTVGQRLAMLPAVFLVAIGVNIAYTASSTNESREDSRRIEVAASQAALQQVFMKETLISQSLKGTDPEVTHARFTQQADSLAHGGSASSSIPALRDLPRAPTEELRAVFLEQIRLGDQLAALGSRYRLHAPGSTGGARIVRDMLALDHLLAAETARGSRLYREWATAKVDRVVFVQILFGSLVAVLGVLLSLWIARSVRDPVREMILTLEQAAEEYKVISTQLQARAVQDSTALSRASETGLQLTAKQNDLAAKAKSVARDGEKATGLAKEGESAIGATVLGLEKIELRTTIASDRMEALARHTQQIDGILDVIDAIAKQINLLAINASIEAAGSQNESQGFAVVAGEIRKLGERAARSAKEIRELVGDIQDSTVAATDAAEDSFSSVVTGRKTVRTAAEVFSAIADLVDQNTSTAEQMDASCQTQSDQVGALTQELKGIAQSVTMSSATVTDLVTAAEDLTRMGQRLKKFAG